VAADPDLVVFPESFLPAYILRNPTALAWLQTVARDGSSEVVFGTGDVRDGRWYNSVVLLDATGDVAATYDMVRPVPFGE
jgi:apolipoprotein N-acyltransferase